MKIAYFLGGLNRGGAETIVLDICKNKDVAPFEICCIYRKEGDYSDSFHATNVPLYQLKRNGSKLSYLINFRKLVLQNHIDVVHAQTPLNALICFFALMFTKVKVVTTFHGFSFSDAPKWYRGIVYRKSKCIICVSDFQKKFYSEKWRLPSCCKLKVVYNGVDFSKFEKKKETDDNCPEESGLLKMAMVGSFVGGRNQMFVCEVLKELEDRCVPFDFYFIGRRDAHEYQRYDDCVAYCEKIGLKDRVHFLGGRSDVPELLKEMDLFVYASEHDTFGIAVLEALASGLPVIVNDWNVMKEITDNGTYADLYKTDDVNDCVEKIIRFVENRKEHPEELKIKNERIAAEVKEKYSISSHIGKLNEVYLSIL